MGIELPPELADVAAQAGVTWPQADEEAMARQAQAWRDTATSMSTLSTDADTTARAALASVSGETATKASTEWKSFVDPDNGHLTSIVRDANAAADRLEHAANQVGAAKVEIVRNLVNLAQNQEAAHAAAQAGHPFALAGLSTAVNGTAANVAHIQTQLVSAVQPSTGVDMATLQTPVNANPGHHLQPGVTTTATDLATHTVTDTAQTATTLTTGTGHQATHLPAASTQAGQDLLRHGGADLVRQTADHLAPGAGDLPHQVTDSAANVVQHTGGAVVDTATHVPGDVSHALPGSGNAPQGPGNLLPATGNVLPAPGDVLTGPGNMLSGQDHPGDLLPGHPGDLVPAHPGDALPGHSNAGSGHPGAGPPSDPEITGPVPHTNFPGDAHTPPLGQTVQAGFAGGLEPSAAPAPVNLPPAATASPLSPAAPAYGGAPGYAGTPIAPPVIGAPAIGAPGVVPAPSGGPVPGGAPAPGGGPAPSGGPAQGGGPAPGGGSARGGGPAPGGALDGAPAPGTASPAQPARPATYAPAAAASPADRPQEPRKQLAGPPGAPPPAKGERNEVLAAFWIHMFPIGHLPVASYRPARQLPPPPPELDYAAGLRFEPADHPQFHLIDAGPRLAEVRAALAQEEAAKAQPAHQNYAPPPGPGYPPAPPAHPAEAVVAGYPPPPPAHPAEAVAAGYPPAEPQPPYPAEAGYPAPPQAPPAYPPVPNPPHPAESGYPPAEAPVSPASPEATPAAEAAVGPTPGHQAEAAPGPAAQPDQPGDPDAETVPNLRPVNPSAGFTADHPTVQNLLENHDPLGGGNERDWDRRYLVRLGSVTPHGISPEGLEYNWPTSEQYPEGGSATGEPEVLDENTVIDRFGTPHGRVFAADGTPFAQRSLPPAHKDAGYRRYKVTRPLPVWRAVSAAWFGQPGGGIRYRTTHSAIELVALGYLEEIA